MITIQTDGKILIPQDECFIGYNGDNLNKTLEFTVKGRADPDLYYRAYLRFDDGTVNYFLLDKRIDSGDTKLFWTVTNDQIYKDGVFELQIKAFNTRGEVFHSETAPLFAGASLEFCSYLAEKPASEFLQQEKRLNTLLENVERAKDYLPYIGTNGNWYVYDEIYEDYIDTGITALGSAEAYPIVTGITENSSDVNVPSAASVYRHTRPLFEKTAQNSDAVNILSTKTGDLSYLNTEDKASLVNAVNELASGKLNNADSSVTTSNLEDLSVTQEKLARGAVTADKLSANSVTAKKIAEGAVTISKISSAYLDDAPSISAPFYGESLVKSGGVYLALQGKYNSSNIESGSGSLTLYTQTAIDSNLINSCEFEYEKVGNLIHTFITIVFNAGSASFLQFKNLPFTCNTFSTLNRMLVATSKVTEALVYPDRTWLNINFFNNRAFTQDENLKFVITTKLI